MKDIIAEVYLYFVIIVVCLVCTLAAIYRHSAIDIKQWNNGYCECGGKWEYEQAVGHR